MSDQAKAHSSSPREGDLIAHKYRITKVLGSGGMGVVVAAQHIYLDALVAIKLLQPAVQANREAIARFIREARAAARIRSEHVARVLDVGALENGEPYLVMEHLVGCDLESLLGDVGVLSIPQAVEFVLQASEAIAEAHSLGIIHRDLKPANLFHVRRPDGTSMIKVLDFGISKLSRKPAAECDVTLTQTAAVMGTPLYMSPEQLQSSRDVDVRADIWSLGVILYQLLVGHVPFSGSTFSALCVQIMTQPFAPLRSIRESIPAELEAVVAKCLEKDRANRYVDLSELATALVPFAPKSACVSAERIHGVLKRSELPPALSETAPSTDSDEHTVKPWGVSESAPARHRAKAIWAALAAVLLVAALGVIGRHWLTSTNEEHAASHLSTITGPDPMHALPLARLPPEEAPTASAQGTTQSATSALASSYIIDSGAGTPVSAVRKRRGVQSSTVVQPPAHEGRTVALPSSSGAAAVDALLSGSGVQSAKRSVYDDRK